MNSVVYFVSCIDRIKIGVSKNLKTRMNAIATSAPDAVTLIGFVQGNRKLEKILHDKLHQHRTVGEWFVDCPEVRAVIDEILADKEQVNKIYFPKFKEPHQPFDISDEELDALNPLMAVIGAAQKRIHSLINSDLVNAVHEASCTERACNLKRGSLISEIVDRDEYIAAFKIVNQSSDKFGEILDKSILSMASGGSTDGFARAAEQQADTAEAAFRGLKIRKRNLKLSFLEEARA